MGSYPLRLADHLMEEAKSAASEDNVSLNQLLATFIADGIGHRRAVLDLKRRARRTDPAAVLEILARAPTVAPDSGDEMPTSTRTARRAK